MNFFKSIFSDDPDPPGSDSEPESETNNAPHNKPQNAPDLDSSPTEHRSDVNPTADPSVAGGWNFGGLIKTLTTKSESIIETYRRDLQEFGTGLKKEIEVAQGSLETVSHKIDEFGSTVVKGTTQIIAQGKDAILAVDLESDSDNSNSKSKNLKYGSEKGLNNSKRYSRFEAQVRAIQGDASTYSEVPEDLNDYNKWKLGFSLEGKSEEMDGFFRENEAMESVYKRVVPNTVDHETFWYRYYYKVYKLKKAEDVRARLVRRMSRDEEDLSWDVEDDDDDEEEEEEEEEEGKNVGLAKPEIVINREVGGGNLGKGGDSDLQDGGSDANSVVGTKRLNEEEVSKVEKRDNLLQSEELENKRDESVEESKVENSEVVGEVGDGSKETMEEAGVDKGSKSEVDKTVNNNDSDKKMVVERMVEDGKSSDKIIDSSLVASQHSAHKAEEEEEEEEDLGWDEIEDLSSFDEKKATRSGSPSKVDLRKRLSAAEEEDLSWDIEDDDEPAKA